VIEKEEDIEEFTIKSAEEFGEDLLCWYDADFEKELSPCSGVKLVANLS